MSDTNYELSTPLGRTNSARRRVGAVTAAGADAWSTAAESLRRNGYCLLPNLLRPTLIADASAAMDEVIAGTYETGLPPSTREWNPGDDPRKLIKINEPHLCDRRIRALVCCPELGRALAGSMEARTIQVWAVQLLVKPPAGHNGGSDLGVAPGFRAALEAGKVGWHQDRQYWTYWTPDSEVFTAWIALSELT
ncbi:MAG TPA: phytanoyl-CoA dioxygenase family protein, partial [Polyangiaceae bacterium]